MRLIKCKFCVLSAAKSLGIGARLRLDLSVGAEQFRLSRMNRGGRDQGSPPASAAVHFTFAIHDIFSKGKYGDMQSFVKKLKELGYERAALVPTDNGRFMSLWEAKWMGLSGSALLLGKK